MQGSDSRGGGEEGSGRARAVLDTIVALAIDRAIARERSRRKEANSLRGRERKGKEETEGKGRKRDPLAFDSGLPFLLRKP